MNHYLNYDLKGIQSFIMAVPKLKYICGASAIVAKFDLEVRNRFGDGNGLVFAGGGKGTLRFGEETQLHEAKDAMRQMAREEGLTICFGHGSEAGATDETYSWLPHPSNMDGHPCAVSGLFPVESGEHPLVKRRCKSRRELREGFDRDFLPSPLSILESLRKRNIPCNRDVRFEFFSNVSPNRNDEPEHDAEFGNDHARAGAASIGNRNRWAVIAMDGNNIGDQHRAAKTVYEVDSGAHAQWLDAMSRSLHETTVESCRAGIASVVNHWIEHAPIEQVEKAFCDDRGICVLPIRPLIVGGDDVKIICHAGLALRLAKAISEQFQQISQTKNRAFEKLNARSLWLATNGELTISAGILFAPIHLPLNSAIAYAELLLASAKGGGRELLSEKHEKQVATPACFDFESVTEGVIWTPALRREKELVFDDPEMDCTFPVRLHSRPWSLAEFEKLQHCVDTYRKIPSNIRAQVLAQLRSPFFERKAFVARLAKRRDCDNPGTRQLIEDLTEPPHSNLTAASRSGRWRVRRIGNESYWTTDVVDALLLLEEEARMSIETLENES